MAKESKIRLNLSVVSGFVAKDAFVNNSKNFLSFTVGYDKGFMNPQTNEWVNQVAWIPVKLWAKEDRIERLAAKLKKGVYVVVVGQNDQSSYKSGKDQSVTINDVFIRASQIQVYSTGFSGNEGSSDAVSGEVVSSADYGDAIDMSAGLDLSFLQDADIT